jgi:molybdopterin-guanine dinucleotide biosynthesis protein A
MPTAAVLAGGRAVRELTAGEIEVFGDRHRLLASVNTPADYEELEGLRRH